MKCTCPECNLSFDAPPTTGIVCPICDTQVTASGSSSFPRLAPLPAKPARIVDCTPDAAPPEPPPSNRRPLVLGVATMLVLLYLVGGVALAAYFLGGHGTSTPPQDSSAADPAPAPAEPPTPPVTPPPAKPVAAVPASESKIRWESKLRLLRSHGLDLVIVFDSTGSMDKEIAQLKKQIYRIGSTLLELVPSARVSVCTYRDFGDAYVAKGLSLTNDIAAIERYLKDIRAGGGGDNPEAVQEGLRWAVENNDFRKDAVKVILLFGDAPPHAPDQATCERYAFEFRERQQGIVSTVTCRKPARIPEFVKMASAGGGESFLVSEPRRIVEQLVVLVFGSEHRDKVLEAFKLLEG